MSPLGTYGYRLLRAALLDPGVYEEVEHDPAALPQAWLTVVLAGVATGIGAGGPRGVSASTFVLFTAVGLASWLLWASLIYMIGGRMTPEPQTRTSFAELLRTIGFAAAPGFVQVFAAFPGAALLAFGLAAIWLLAAMVVAVRQALDYRTTGHAMAVCAMAWVIAVLLPLAIAILFSRPAS